MEGCWTCSWWALSGTVCAWQRPPTTRPTTSHIWKTRGCQCSFRLLMIGGVSPETCRALYKYGIIKFWYFVASCWIFLYELYYDARMHEHQVYFCLSTSLSADPSFYVPPQSLRLIMLSSHLTWMSLLRPAARYCGCCFWNVTISFHYLSSSVDCTASHLCYLPETFVTLTRTDNTDIHARPPDCIDCQVSLQELSALLC